MAETEFEKWIAKKNAKRSGKKAAGPKEKASLEARSSVKVTPKPSKPSAKNPSQSAKEKASARRRSRALAKKRALSPMKEVADIVKAQTAESSSQGSAENTTVSRDRSTLVKIGTKRGTRRRPAGTAITKSQTQQLQTMLNAEGSTRNSPSLDDEEENGPAPNTKTNLRI